MPSLDCSVLSPPVVLECSGLGLSLVYRRPAGVGAHLSVALWGDAMSTTYHSTELQKLCDLRACPVCGEIGLLYGGSVQAAEFVSVVALCPCGGRDDWYLHAGQALSLH